MRTASFLVLATLLLSVASLGYRPSSAAASDADATGEASKVHPRSYRLNDLPVWSADGKVFDPTILMAYIKATVDPNTWDSTSSMAPYVDSNSLVIATTPANHDSITTALESLRTQVTVADK
ncbi:hypothetical protein [Neorhodopirellula lusitana]|uniref:hypothetical protein n=1 Tax=Neorhodopirellula lusitana TaxID=445327 RepID=UPI00384FAEC2